LSTDRDEVDGNKERVSVNAFKDVKFVIEAVIASEL